MLKCKSLRSSIVSDGTKNFEKVQKLVLEVYGHWFSFIAQEIACLSKNRTERHSWLSQNNGSEAILFVESSRVNFQLLCSIVTAEK